jgi:hypothetical protein
MLNHNVTFFKGLRSTKPFKTMSLMEVLNQIKDGEWRERVEPCSIDINKKNVLPCFTPTGKFNHRSIKGLEEYNGLICLDIDHVEDPAALKQKVAAIDWVTSAFITPSGKGLKVLVQTQGTTDNYKQTEELVAHAFFEATGINRDSRAKDIARIQFVSYDPEIYINVNALVFNQELYKSC